MSDADASSYLQDYHSMSIGVLNEYRKKARFPYFYEYLLDMSIPEEFIDFCVSFEKVYIYGTGRVAGRITNWLRTAGMEYEGYIVSDGHRDNAKWNGKSVYPTKTLWKNIKYEYAGTFLFPGGRSQYL